MEKKFSRTRSEPDEPAQQRGWQKGEFISCLFNTTVRYHQMGKCDGRIARLLSHIITMIYHHIFSYYYYYYHALTNRVSTVLCTRQGTIKLLPQYNVSLVPVYNNVL